MRLIKKHFILTAALLFIFLVLSGNNLFSRISCNGSGGGYDNQQGVEGFSALSPIEGLVIDGAGYYLRGNFYIQTFLNRVELQDVKDIDYNELKRLIDDALENISNARFTYERLVETAASTPYHPVISHRLKTFDYETFMRENRLNEAAFKQIAGYLSRGDITGSFKHVLNRIKSIEILLFIAGINIDYNHIPPLEICWKLNELCAGVSLFCSYSARIFHSIFQQ